MKSKTENKNFRTWKSGKVWLYAATVLVVLAGGTAVYAATASTNASHPVVVLAGATDGTLTNVNGVVSSNTADQSGAYLAMSNRVVLASSIASAAKSFAAMATTNTSAVSSQAASIESVAAAQGSTAASYMTVALSQYAAVGQSKKDYATVSGYDAQASAGSAGAASQADAAWQTYIAEAITINSNFDAFNKGGHQVETALGALGGYVSATSATSSAAAVPAHWSGALGALSAAVGQSNAVAATVSATRLFNPTTGQHLLSVDPNEVSTLLASGWKSEGVMFTAATSGTVGVHRVRNAASGAYLYTQDPNELKALVAGGWTDEGIMFYSSGSVNVYRLFNKTTGQHVYSVDMNEVNKLGASGWTFESVAFNVVSAG